MMFAGSDAPCASAFFMSIGKIGPEENKAHAAAIYPLVEKYLGISGDRMYILFNNAAYHDVAIYPLVEKYLGISGEQSPRRRHLPSGG